MAGGGIYRADQVKFAYAEEAVDGTVPSTVASSLGLIKGGVTLPDVEYDWDMFYGVDRAGRGRKNAHLGNQSFSGSIPQIYFLFEGSRGIMELILGELSTDTTTLAGTNPGVITAVDSTTMTDSGESFETSLAVKDGNYAVFSGISVGYIENETGTADTVVTVWPTPDRGVSGGTSGWNGPQPIVGDTYEIRKTESVGVATGDKFIVPLQRLHTMSWAVQHRNTIAHGGTSVGSALTVNYLGGKVNRATLSARQGEKLMLSLDEVIFRDLAHNSALPSTSVAKYDASTVVPSATHPTEEPIVFSQGTLSLFELGNSFARIRDFTLSINNNITAERYISTTTLNGATVITQIPYELTEGNREITLEVTAIMETLEYYEHLMRQGQADALTSKTGFDIQLKFQANAAATEFFYIQGPCNVDPTIIASSATPVNTTQAQSATTNVGCVLTAAPHEIPGEQQPLIEVRLSIDVPNLVMWYTDA